MQSQASSVEQYLAELPPERQSAVRALHRVFELDQPATA